MRARVSSRSGGASKDPAERYYASIYLEHIERHLEVFGAGRRLRILDAGCGAGKLLLPLAERGHDLTGVDGHGPSMERARAEATRRGLCVEFRQAELGAALREFPAQAFDAARSVGVLYLNRNYKEILADLARLMRPGRLLFNTHRTRYYYLLRSLRAGDFEDALRVSSASSGELRKRSDRIYCHWQTRSEIEALYPSLGLSILQMLPIGPCSGFGLDGLGAICSPGELSESKRAMLRKIETTADEDLLMTSRYVLVVARMRV